MALILPSPLYSLFLALLISFFLSLSFSNCHSGGRVGMPPLPHIELPASSVVEISGNVASLMRSAAWLSLRQHYGLDSIPVLSIEIKRFSFKHAKDFKGEKNVVLVIDLWVSLLSFAFFLCWIAAMPSCQDCIRCGSVAHGQSVRPQKFQRRPFKSKPGESSGNSIQDGEEFGGNNHRRIRRHLTGRIEKKLNGMAPTLAPPGVGENETVDRHSK